jgi:hypothetical protein
MNNNMDIINNNNYNNNYNNINNNNHSDRIEYSINSTWVQKVSLASHLQAFLPKIIADINSLSDGSREIFDRLSLDKKKIVAELIGHGYLSDDFNFMGLGEGEQAVALLELRNDGDDAVNAFYIYVIYALNQSSNRS